MPSAIVLHVLKLLKKLHFFTHWCFKKHLFQPLCETLCFSCGLLQAPCSTYPLSSDWPAHWRPVLGAELSLRSSSLHFLNHLVEFYMMTSSFQQASLRFWAFFELFNPSSRWKIQNMFMQQFENLHVKWHFISVLEILESLRKSVQKHISFKVSFVSLCLYS